MEALKLIAGEDWKPLAFGIAEYTTDFTEDTSEVGSDEELSSDDETEKYKVTVAMIRISRIHHENGRNYAGLREMVYALENTSEALEKELISNLKIPEKAQKDIWKRVYYNNENKLATVRVINRGSGDLKKKDYALAQANEANGFLNVGGSIMIAVRELANLAGLEDYRLEYHKDKDSTQFVNLFEQKRVIFRNNGQTTIYTGFVDNDNAYLAKADAEGLLGAGYTLAEHDHVKEYVNVTSALKNKYSDNAKFIMANFCTTHSSYYANKTISNGTVTVVAEVPSNQSTHPAQVIQVDNYGLIRIFAKMKWDADPKYVVPVDNRQGLKDTIEKAIKEIGSHHIDSSGNHVPGIWANSHSNQKDFHINSQIVWNDSKEKAISGEEQIYHVYSVKSGRGRASGGPGLKFNNDEDRNVIGANWYNNKSYTAHLFADDDFNNSLTIIHETFHLLGLEDAYEYTKASEKMVKPRASKNLVPNNAMMYANQKIMNLEMRMVFDAKAKNEWTVFKNYESKFEIVPKDDFDKWLENKTTEAINNICKGVVMTTDNKVMISYSKEREYLIASDRANVRGTDRRTAE